MKKIIKVITIIVIIAAIAAGFILLAGHFYVGDEFYNASYAISEDGESITLTTVYDARYYSGMSYYVEWGRTWKGDTHVLESYDRDIEHYLGAGRSEGKFTFDAAALSGGRVEFTFNGRGDNDDAVKCFTFTLGARGKFTVKEYQVPIEIPTPVSFSEKSTGVSQKLLPFEAVWALNGTLGKVEFCSAEDDNPNIPHKDINNYYPMEARLSASSMFFEQVLNDVPDGAEVKVMFGECADEYMPEKVSVLMHYFPYEMSLTTETRGYDVEVKNGSFTFPVEHMSARYQYYIIECEWKNGRASYYCFSVNCQT